jgi:glycosyltransferase involved in cell wall biosynthesis
VIRRVGIVVPARNEAARIAACIDALQQAAARLTVPTHIVVVADSCHDETAAAAREALDEGDVVEVVLGSAGAARALGVARLLRLLDSVPSDRVWLASTDADTVVPPDWLKRHLRCAAAGAVAAAGVIELDSFVDLPPVVAERFASIYDGPLDEEHSHVHAANLGVRADAYVAAGGWPPLATGEEHHLWSALRKLGLRTMSPRWLRVTTSARTTSRVTGGFADWLLELSGAQVA